MIIDLDLNKCSACGACAIACIDQNDIDVTKGEKPFRSVLDVETWKDGKPHSSYLSVGCMHCTEAPCIMACPCDCLSKDEETGFTVYDNTDCIGCQSCAMACPFGAPTFIDGKMKKCDGCVERVKNKMEPACVRICPTGALQMLTDEEYAERTAKNSLKHETETLIQEMSIHTQ